MQTKINIETHTLSGNDLRRNKPPRFTATLFDGELQNIQWIDPEPSNSISYINKAKAFIKSQKYDHRRSI